MGDAHPRKMGSFDEKVGGLSVTAEQGIVAGVPHADMGRSIAQMFYTVKFAVLGARKADWT